MTPHSSAWTAEMIERRWTSITDNVDRFFTGRPSSASINWVKCSIIRSIVESFAGLVSASLALVLARLTMALALSDKDYSCAPAPSDSAAAGTFVMPGAGVSALRPFVPPGTFGFV